MNGKPKWEFPDSQEDTGFVNSQTSEDTLGAEIAVRELVQNTIDANRKKGPPIHVSFVIEEVNWTEIPDHVRLREQIRSRIGFWRATDSPPQAEQIMKRMEQTIDAKKVRVLVVRDSGKGISRTGMGKLVGNGAGKKREGDLGSFGLGHQAVTISSRIHTVMYAGHGEDGFIVGGYGVIASNDSDTPDNGDKAFFRTGRGGRGEGRHSFASGEENLSEFTKRHLREQEEATGSNTASAIIVLAFNDFQEANPEDAIVEALARNFAIPIIREELIAAVDDRTKQPPNPLIVDRHIAEKRLEQSSNERRARTKGWLNGFEAYRNWQTIMEGGDGKIGDQIVTTAGEKIAMLHRPAAVGNKSNITIIRDGMVITDSRYSSNMPVLFNSSTALRELARHHVVVHVEYKNAPRAATAIRVGEGPNHMDIKTSRMEDDQKDAINNLMNDIRSAIAERYPPVKPTNSWIEDSILAFPNTGLNRKTPGGVQDDSLKGSRFVDLDPVGQQRTTSSKRKPKPKPEPGNGPGPSDQPKSLVPRRAVRHTRATHRLGSAGNEHTVVIQFDAIDAPEEAFEIWLEEHDGRSTEAGESKITLGNNYAHIEHGEGIAGADATEIVRNPNGAGQAVRVQRKKGTSRVQVGIRTTTPPDVRRSWLVRVTEART